MTTFLIFDIADTTKYVQEQLDNDPKVTCGYFKILTSGKVPELEWNAPIKLQCAEP